MPVTLHTEKRANRAGAVKGRFTSLALVGAVILVMAAVSLISPIELFGLRTSRANLFPEFLEYDEEPLQEEFSADFDNLYEQISAESDSCAAADTSAVITFLEEGDSLPEFDHQFRIAFMGDSFIEGDILTKDLRESLQSEVGGRGVGFVPCALPFGVYRQSAKSTGEGWRKFSIMKSKAVPEAYKDCFLASGYMDAGPKGAVMTWEQKPLMEHLDSAGVCRIVFLSEEGGSIEVSTAEGREPVRFDVEASPRLRQVVLRSYSSTITLKVTSGSLICYGASFESPEGVIVDNFSVRSNSGDAIFHSNAALNRQLNDFLGYDLVVLQYGLNIMLPDKTNYSKYQAQLEDVIKYVKAGFPGSQIVVMGVSERGVLRDGDTTYTSINSAPALSRHQKAAADAQGVLFWDTYGAMESLGGLDAFVRNGWIAADRTHFNFYGGKAIAKKMYPFIKEVLVEKKRSDRGADSLRSVSPDSVLFAPARKAPVAGNSAASPAAGNSAVSPVRKAPADEKANNPAQEK